VKPSHRLLAVSAVVTLAAVLTGCTAHAGTTAPGMKTSTETSSPAPGPASAPRSTPSTPLVQPLQYTNRMFGPDSTGGKGISLDAPAGWRQQLVEDHRVAIYSAPRGGQSLRVDARTATTKLGAAVAARQHSMPQMEETLLEDKQGRVTTSAWYGRPLTYRTLTYLGRDGHRLTIARFVTLETSLHDDSSVASLTISGPRADATALHAILQRATISLVVAGG
jgi:hypothetical protein